MIPAGTVLAVDPRSPVESAVTGQYCWSWHLETSSPFSVPVEVARADDLTDVGFRVETWFQGGCRDCLHHKNVGSVVSVHPDQEFLLKNGEFIRVGDLQHGMRIRSIGCSCGYEEVKNISESPIDELYSVRTANGNYAVSTGQYAMVLRSDP